MLCLLFLLFSGASNAQQMYVASVNIPAVLATRTTGVAPLAVFFDASGTTDTVETPYPFHELDYSWNFGDSGAGNWTYGSGNVSYPCGNGMSSSFTATIDNGSGGAGNTLTVSALSLGSVGLEVPLSASGLTGNPVVTAQVTGAVKGQTGTYTVNGSAQLVASTTFTDNEVTPTNTYCQAWNASKNVAYGPVVAHVFETTGTYTVSLTVKGASSSQTATTTITVSDPQRYFLAPIRHV